MRRSPVTAHGPSWFAVNLSKRSQIIVKAARTTNRPVTADDQCDASSAMNAAMAPDNAVSLVLIDITVDMWLCPSSLSIETDVLFA